MRHATRLGLVLLACLGSGCVPIAAGVALGTSGGGGGGGGGAAPGPAPPPTAPSNSNVIGADGGTYTSQGLTLVVPIRAVSEDTAFTVARGFGSLAEGEYVAVGDLFTLSPSEVFQSALEVRVPFDPGRIPSGFSASDLYLIHEKPGGAVSYFSAGSDGAQSFRVHVNELGRFQVAVRSGADANRSSIAWVSTAVVFNAQPVLIGTLRNAAGLPVPFAGFDVVDHGDLFPAGNFSADAQGRISLPFQPQRGGLRTVTIRVSSPQAFDLVSPPVEIIRPATPTGFQAVANGATQVTLTWTDNGTQETGYHLERSQGAGFSTVTTTGSNVQSHVDTTASASTSYTYRLTILTDNGDVVTTSVTTPGSPPSAPTGLSATPQSQTRVDLAWTDTSSDETSFRVERRLQGASAWSVLASLAANTTSYSDTGATANTSYQYRVASVSAGGASPSAIVPAATPGPPNAAATGLNPLYVGEDRVRVTWADNASNETSYRLERALGSGAFETIATLGANATSGEDPRAAASTAYRYRVTALNSYGSTESAIRNFTTPGALTAPGTLQGLYVGPQVRLVWVDTSSNETGFRVQRRILGQPVFSELAQLAAGTQTYDDAGAAAGTTYEYQVVALNATAEAPSGTVSVATPAGTSSPAAPTALAALARAHRVALCWEDNASDETGYRIERQIGSGAFVVLAETGPDVTSYRDLSAAAGTTYGYRVSALGAVPSAASNVASASVPVWSALSFAVVSKETNALYEIDTGALGTPTLLGTITRGTDLAGIAATDSTSDYLWLLARNENKLVSFSTDTKVEATSRDLDATLGATRRGLALHPHGWLTAVSGDGALRYVSQGSGNSMALGTFSGLSRVEALAFSPDGTLYALGSAGNDDASERLYTVDLNTATATEVGLHGVADLDGLSWGPDGYLYALDAQVGTAAILYRLDPATGAARALGSTGVKGASGIQVIPRYASGGGRQAPVVDSVIPPTVVEDTDVQIVLRGKNLTTGITVWGGVGVGIGTSPSFSGSPEGDFRLLSLRVGSSAPNPIVLRVENASGEFLLEIERLPRASLAVPAKEEARLAGTISLGSLRVCAGGRVRGVGLTALALVCDGEARVEGVIDVSGEDGYRPQRWTPASLCGRGGDGGPGGGGGGGGGASHPQIGTDDTLGGDGGWGFAGGGGGGSAGTLYRGGHGGLGSGAFGEEGSDSGAPGLPIFSQGGPGGISTAIAGSGYGGKGGFGGGGGGTGVAFGLGGEGGPTTGIADARGTGGAGAQHNTDGAGGGGGSYGTAGTNGRESNGPSTGGGPAGQVNGSAEIPTLGGGSGGGGGSGRGGFEGLAGGGGGGGGVLYLRGSSITVTGSILANGGDGGRHPVSDGEGGAGSGGAILLQGPLVNVASGATIEATGGTTPTGSGLGGAGRVRVDAQTLQVDGAGATQVAFAARSAPAVGFFGSATPTIAIQPQGTSPFSGAVRLDVTLSDADSSRLTLVDLEVSVGGGPFQPLQLTRATDAVNRRSAPGGQRWPLFWNSVAQLGAGTFTVVVRGRAAGTNTSAYGTSATFTVSN